MISTKKLTRMAKKWQRLAARTSRGRMILPRTRSFERSSQMVAEKGCFVIYTTDDRRYSLPLEFLESAILKELLRLAEEEFGLTSDGPITIPCDSIFMEYALSIIQSRVDKELEEALVISLSNCYNSSSLSMCSHHNQSAISCC